MHSRSISTMAIALALIAGTAVSTQAATQAPQIERTAVTQGITAGTPTVLLAATPVVKAPGSSIEVERAAFTAKATPPPPPPPTPVILAGRTGTAAPVSTPSPPAVPSSASDSTPAPAPVRAVAPERSDNASPVKTKVAEASQSEVSTSSSSIVETGKKYLGVPYVWGGTNPSVGLDCSGFTQLVFRQHGINLPRVARAQAKVGTRINSLAEAQPGDLVGMRNGSHIAIYAGDGKILHSPRPGETVSIRSLTSYDDIDVIRRFK